MMVKGLNMDGIVMDTREMKIRRAALGAFYGFLGGAAFVFTAAFIDIWLNPDVHFGVDWSTFAARLPLIALGLALVGAATCWWPETWQGLLSGAVVTAALTLIVSLASPDEVNTGAKFIVLVFLLMPTAAMALPMAWLMRWFTERHARALRSSLSSGRIAGLIVIALALGAGGGYFMKTPPRGVEVANFMLGLLQNPSQVKNPLAGMENVQAHRNTPYKLYEQRSETSTVGYDVRIEYEDGFVLQCTILAYPGSDLVVSACETRE
jgi:hypothetical protein